MPDGFASTWTLVKRKDLYVKFGKSQAIPHSEWTSHSGNRHDWHTLKALNQRIIAKFERDYLMVMGMDARANSSETCFVAVFVSMINNLRLEGG